MKSVMNILIWDMAVKEEYMLGTPYDLSMINENSIFSLLNQFIIKIDILFLKV